MNTLEKICLCSVAHNASCYEIQDFQALNVYILEQLVSYLGAYQLNRLHDIFVKAGVEVERVWKRHLALHWNGAYDFPPTIFTSDNVRGNGTESRRVYLERLFQKVISNLDSGTDEPHYITNLKRLPRCRHGICFQCLDSTALDSNVLQRKLPQYAVHVQILSIAATSPMIQYLLKEPNLLKILQGTVRRLDTRHINSRNFAATRELVQLLVQEGSVSEFSIFQARLSSKLLENLMRLVSGQQAEQCTGSLSAMVEYSDAEAEKERSVEDQACTSTEVIELGKNSFAGHNDVNIPHMTMTTVDGGKNLTRTDEMIKASEDSVARSCDLVDDDDLYDVALTTSGAKTNISRSCFHVSMPGGPRCLCAANGLTIKPTECSASASHLGNSQSGFENPGNAVTNLGTSSTLVSGSTSPGSVSPPRSCTSFSLAYYCGFYVDNLLLRVLKNWTTLQKLALFEISDCCADTSCPCGDVDIPAYSLEVHESERVDFGKYLYRAIQINQLTHVVSYDVNLGVDVVYVITYALLTKQNDRPLEQVKIVLKPQEDYTSFLKLFYSTEGFFGTVCLQFYESYASDVMTSEFVMSWLHSDRALRCLHLPRFGDPSYLTKALEILECNERLEELHMSTNSFDASSASALISVLQTCPSLRKLSLDDCELSKEDIDGKLFVEAISMHPTLTELSLRDNYLEDVGCDLLKAICLRNRFFNSLDLSFNRIEGELLFEMCQEIQTELRKCHRSRFPLSVLDLSENIFHQEWRNRLVQTLVDWVDVFVAQDPNLGNPAGSLADHISLM